MHDIKKDLKLQPQTLYLAFTYLNELINKRHLQTQDSEQLINHAMVLLGIAIKYNETSGYRTKSKVVKEHYSMLKQCLQEDSRQQTNKTRSRVALKEFSILS